MAVLERREARAYWGTLVAKGSEPRLHAGRGWLSAHMGFQGLLQLADARCTNWCFTGAAECWASVIKSLFLLLVSDSPARLHTGHLRSNQYYYYM
jgi:hypothetical protein